MSAGYDAQLQNSTSREVRQYSDLDLFFGKKTSDSDINKVTDVQAVKRSIRNLVQLNVYDKPFHPEISGGVREMLFENMTPIVGNILARKVEDVINNFEPRVNLVGVRAQPDLDRNRYSLQISFYVIGIPQIQTVESYLERLR